MVNFSAELSSEFHRGLASPEWLRSLESYVEEEIRLKCGHDVSNGRGVVRSEFNEDRYMGPHSAVKFHFIVEVEVARRSPSSHADRYTFFIRYIPGESTFKTRQEEFDTEETRELKTKEVTRREDTAESMAQELRSTFENRKAIYVEQGVSLVQVSKIQQGSSGVAAEVMEIPAVGLPTRRHAPKRWPIEAACHLTWFTKDTWGMGYGGWTLFFQPQIVRGVTRLAASWRYNTDSAKWRDGSESHARYREARHWISHSDHMGRFGRPREAPFQSPEIHSAVVEALPEGWQVVDVLQDEIPSEHNRSGYGGELLVVAGPNDVILKWRDRGGAVHHRPMAKEALKLWVMPPDYSDGRCTKVSCHRNARTRLVRSGKSARIYAEPTQWSPSIEEVRQICNAGVANTWLESPESQPELISWDNWQSELERSIENHLGSQA